MTDCVTDYGQECEETIRRIFLTPSPGDALKLAIRTIRRLYHRAIEVEAIKAALPDLTRFGLFVGDMEPGVSFTSDAQGRFIISAPGMPEIRNRSALKAVDTYKRLLREQDKAHGIVRSS